MSREKKVEGTHEGIGYGTGSIWMRIIKEKDLLCSYLVAGKRMLCCM